MNPEEGNPMITFHLLALGRCSELSDFDERSISQRLKEGSPTLNRKTLSSERYSPYPRRIEGRSVPVQRVEGRV